jgi:hypothetical protein
MLSDFIGRRELRRTALYADLFRPLGGEHLIAVTLPSPPALVIGLGLFRRARGFSERDRAALDFLRPLLATGYQAVAARTTVGTFEQIAVAEERGVMIARRSGGVLYESALATEWLERYFGRSNGDLPTAVDRWLHDPSGPLEAVAGSSSASPATVAASTCCA